jgi:hypothetical protein
MHHERRTNRGGPLPLEVRRILWQRVWDRLLAPPPRGQATHAESPDETIDETRAGRRG